MHGHVEHVSRYDAIFARFAHAGIRVLAFDQVGCGQTGLRSGDLGGVKGAEQLLHDITHAIDFLDRHDVPLFLLGNSLVTCWATLTP